MNSLMTQGNLKQKNLNSKLVCFDVNGVSTFQGLRLGMTLCSICYMCALYGTLDQSCGRNLLKPTFGFLH
jgi:hypothetical protein